MEEFGVTAVAARFVSPDLFHPTCFAYSQRSLTCQAEPE
jgi:hypothetical protein